MTNHFNIVLFFNLHFFLFIIYRASLNKNLGIYKSVVICLIKSFLFSFFIIFYQLCLFLKLLFFIFLLIHHTPPKSHKTFLEIKVGIRFFTIYIQDRVHRHQPHSSLNLSHNHENLTYAHSSGALPPLLHSQRAEP